MPTVALCFNALLSFDFANPCSNWLNRYMNADERNMTVRTLFMMHYGSNEGYALEKLERIFFRVGVSLAGGDATKVHFSYADFKRGAPRSLPPGFPNTTPFVMRNPSIPDYHHIGEYVREHKIDLVVPFDLQPTHPLCRVLRLAGARTIVPYWGAPISSPNRGWKLALKRLEVLLSRSKADGLIFESTAMAELAVTGRGYPAGQVDVVPLGVDIDRYCPGTSGAAHQLFGLPESRRIFVSCGHIYAGKGIGTLVEAAMILLGERQRRDACFVMFGNRAREHEPFEQMYAGRDFAALIRFGGYREDLAEMLRGCFCGVVPSIVQESFSFSSIELAASGLPVVASRIGGLTDSVVDGETGILVEPNNPVALADALESLLDEPARARELGMRGRARCERELNVEAHCARLTSVFQQRLAKTRGQIAFPAA